MILTINDATLGGDILNKITLDVFNEMITVRDLIAARVETEVNSYNKKLPEYFNGLVKPTDAEKTLNGFKIKSRKKIDVEKQTYVALDAFLSNGYFILIDDQQVTDLEQEILVSKTTTINFVKLTPLVGG